MKARKTRRLVVALAVMGLLCASAAAAWAGTVTDPNTNPFNVPRADANGNPNAFTVSATGMPANTFIFIEQCDGSDPNVLPPLIWNPTDHCDGTTGNAPVKSDASGNVTFPANDAITGCSRSRARTRTAATASTASRPTTRC